MDRIQRRNGARNPVAEASRNQELHFTWVAFIADECEVEHAVAEMALYACCQLAKEGVSDDARAVEVLLSLGLDQHGAARFVEVTSNACHLLLQVGDDGRWLDAWQVLHA